MCRHVLDSTQRVAATTDVWSGLSRDQQQRAVRLLAPLAYAQVRTCAPLPAPEDFHVHASEQRQDSPRSS
jgi:hypothetical protein